MKKYGDIPKKIDVEEKAKCEKCGCDITSKNMVTENGRKLTICVKCYGKE